MGGSVPYGHPQRGRFYAQRTEIFCARHGKLKRYSFSEPRIRRRFHRITQGIRNGIPEVFLLPDVVIEFGKQRDVPFAVRPVSDLRNSCRGTVAKGDVLPDPVSRQIGRPIPAEMALRLSQKDALLIEAGKILFRIDLLHALQRGSHAHAKEIIFFQQLRHVVFVTEKHVFRFTQQLAVEAKLRKRVYSPKGENTALSLLRFPSGKFQRIFVIAFQQETFVLIIHAEIGIGYPARRITVGRDIAGHPRGEYFTRLHAPQLPFSV